MKISIQFGALYPPLKQQLGLQDVICLGVEEYQKDIEAITRLRIRNLLSDSMTDKTRRKLLNDIVKNCKEATK